jgi:hypothetical protein
VCMKVKGVHGVAVGSRGALSQRELDGDTGAAAWSHRELHEVRVGCMESQGAS